MCGSSGSNQVTETETQVAQADINKKMWDYYQKNYKPLVQKYAASVTDPATTAAENKKVTGQINADVMKMAKPVSPSNATANAKNMMNVADVKANAETAGKLGEKGREIGQEMNVIDIGRGQTTKAMEGMDVLAGQSVNAAIQDKELELEDKAMTENTIGSAVGTIAGAAAGYGLYGKGLTASNDRTEVPNTPPKFTYTG